MSRHVSPVPALLALGLASLVSVPQPVHAQTAQAQQKPVLTTLHRFDGTHGAFPAYRMTLGTDGSFYGATYGGGLGVSEGNFGYGTVFKMTPSGQYLTLWRFDSKNGANPSGSLVQGGDGAFYGTTYNGGSNNYGTVFRITPQGQLTTLHSFSTADGRYPNAPLLSAPDGSFYGTVGSAGKNPFGSVFHMAADGKVTILHSFDLNHGSSPTGGLAYGTDGALYGTTSYGGGGGAGTVYRLATGGAFSTLHEFNNDDGEMPIGGLALGSDGALYGMTSYGGNHHADNRGGVIYKITPSGRFTLLHVFSEDGHGIGPNGPLALGIDGNFYGTTVLGGTSDKGTAFVMTPSGQVTTLYKFHTAFDGHGPVGGLAFGMDGVLFGTTLYGGPSNYGTLYKLILP